MAAGVDLPSQHNKLLYCFMSSILRRITIQRGQRCGYSLKIKYIFRVITIFEKI